MIINDNDKKWGEQTKQKKDEKKKEEGKQWCIDQTIVYNMILATRKLNNTLPIPNQVKITE